MRRQSRVAWLRRLQPAARLRLTVLYSAMFLVSGAIALAIVYLVAAGHPPTTTAGAPGRAFLNAQRHADLSHLLQASALVLLAGTAGSALLGWFVAGRALRPVRTITAAAREISATNLHARLALDGPDDELKELGDTLDDLLARLDASFEAQRRFVANAAHELRTPLTLERTLLQVALADPDAPAARLRDTCEELLTVGKDHERLLEALLTLASTEGGLEHRTLLDIANVAENALRPSRFAIDGFSIETTLMSAPVWGDATLLERLISNLLENAALYNVRAGQINVETGSRAGESFLTVSNTGPTIPAATIDRLFEPFQRGGPDHAASGAHHGLGLSIVRAISNAHDATLIARAKRDGGLAIAVTFPGGAKDQV